MARPGKYETHVKPKLGLVEVWARDGLSDEGIAKKLGISRDTLIGYKKEFSDFSDTLKRGKDVVDAEVENALLKRALGYEYEEVTEEYENGSLTKTKKTIKQVVPDVGAQAFWLKNRKPDDWRDRQELGITGGIDEIRNAYDKAAAAIKKQGG